MKYHFRAGRGKNIIISDTKTFEDAFGVEVDDIIVRSDIGE